MATARTRPKRHGPDYHRRQLAVALLRAAGLFALFLTVGAVGLWLTDGGNLPEPVWINAIFGASMILTGMGPAPDAPLTPAAKLFLSAYALISGVGFLAVMGMVLQPMFHRLLHEFHMEAEEAD